MKLNANGLALQIKSCKLEGKVDDLIVCVLLYADDVILLAEHEKDLQQMLNVVAEWCWKCRLNQDKTQ